ncbi:lactase-like protein [Ciona intestinalis]
MLQRKTKVFLLLTVTFVVYVVYTWMVRVKVVMAEVKFEEDDDGFLYGEFPNSFQWSVATSAYQVEGGADQGGRGASIWDHYSHVGGIADGSNGDVACDSYNRHKEDVALVKQLGVTSYRFSISWSRVLPTGKIDNINEEGISYYNNLINDLIAANIQPVVTLYHWDLPLALQNEFGGWLSDVIIPLFVDYAELCFQRYGDRVKTWITLNEPRVVASGYETKDMAPGLNKLGVGGYRSSYVMLKAHARAYHTYVERYKQTQRGRIGITLNCDWGVPHDATPLNKEASTRFMQWYIGLYAHPIYVGGWPKVIEDNVGEKSRKEGRSESRLPAFAQAELDDIIGTSDFLGLNSYTAVIVNHKRKQSPGLFTDSDITTTLDASWPPSGSSWLAIYPPGIRKVLSWIKGEYPGYGSILITENGVSETDQSGCFNLCDQFRVNFFKNYTNNVLKAIRYDGVNVEGYTAWSLLDNFEWARGYKERFGIHHVDFNTLKRTPKASALFYKRLVENNGIPSRGVLGGWMKEIEGECARENQALCGT